ncbi:MAG TPA: HD domain-containing phosphohydrolase [Candidatus Binatia bacterium]|nr:HD domain-containing phosphohydrolase [Candidatus Binatia bacterium]
MIPSVELLWALAAAVLLLVEQVRHRRSLRHELKSLRSSYDAAIHRNDELTQASDKMGDLYRYQLLTSRKRAARIKKVLEIATSINSNLSLDVVLHEIVHAVSDAAGFRIVLLRVLNEGGKDFEARAFAGLSREAIRKLEQHVVPRTEFESWLKEEFRVGRSYFISHERKFWGEEDEEGYTPELGVRQEGEWHQEDVLFVPLYTKDGAAVGYFSVDDPVDRRLPSRETIETLEILATHAVVAIQNASLYERLNESMARLEEATERSEQVAELKNQFISTVSHELLTPLTAIRAYAEALLEHVGSTTVDMQRQFLGVIDEQSLKLRHLIDSILELSQLESGRFRMVREPFNLTALTHEVVTILASMADTKKITLVVETSVPEIVIEADRELMRRVLNNLGSNAIKFTHEAGTVTFRLAIEGRAVRIQVEDTGIGIPEDGIGRIFDKFYQIDNSLSREYPGVGLGLTISKSIVEWHGGEISAESKAGIGSRFTVLLPVTAGDAHVITHASWTPSRSVSNHLTRLTVEMIAEVMNARTASFMLVDEERSELYIRAARGLREEVVCGTRVRIGDSIAGWVAKHGQPLLVTNIEEDPRFGRPNGHQYETKSLLSVPVKIEGRVVGVININNKISRTPFTEDDRALLSSLADRVALAWKRVSDHERSSDRTEETAKALTAIIENARRSRLKLNGGSMAGRAVAVGRKLGLAEEDLEALAYVASVHDVGMGQVDLSVLQEPGRLDDETWAQVALHPLRSAEIVKPIEFQEQVTEIIMAHHERMDGRGYPKGLQGSQIPIGARIIAVLDAYESMTIGRPYREAMAHAEALREIQQCKGTQFDSRVVEAFSQVFESEENTKLVRSGEPA